MARRSADLLDASALRAIIERGGARFRNGPQSYVFSCPKCLGKNKLYVRKRDGRSKCMKCGESGGINGWADLALAELLGRPQAEMRALLYGDALPIGTEQFQPQLEDHWTEFGYDDEYVPSQAEPLPEILWDPNIIDLTETQAWKATAYLAERGVTLAVALRYGVRYNPAERRVVFPVEANRSLVGWQSRYMGLTEWYDEAQGRWVVIPKMLTVGAIGGKALMFGDRLKGSGHGILTEGPFDAIKCDLAGGNVASMGKGVTKTQIDLMLRAGIRRLYIGLDDDAAEDTMRVISEATSRDVECFKLDPPPGYEDLGAASPEENLEQFHAAKRAYAGQLFIYFKKGLWG